MKNLYALTLLVVTCLLASCSQVTPPSLEAQAFYANSSNIRMKTADWIYGGEVFNLNTYGSEFPYTKRVWVKESGKDWRLIKTETIPNRAAEVESNRLDDFLFVRDPYPVLAKGTRYWVNLTSTNDQHTRCMQNNVRYAC